MAGSKKPRKKYSPIRSTGTHIDTVVNRCMSKFHYVGDMNHPPLAYHYGDIALHLKGEAKKVAYEHIHEQLLDKPGPWTLIGYHFFNLNEKIEVIPATIVVPDVTLQDMGDRFEDLLKDLRDSITASDKRFHEGNLAFYGYYLTYGEDLQVDRIEKGMVDSLFKITDDMTNIQPYIVKVDADSLFKALGEDKYTLLNNPNKTTTMVLEEG